MSAVKMHPPQTYSRLFRPWDSQRNNCFNAGPIEGLMKQERFAAKRLAIKDEHNAFNSADNERECASSSSSSSSKSSYDDGLNSSYASASQLPQYCLPRSGEKLPAASAAPHLYNPLELEHQHQMQLLAGMPPASELYYAAAAAAAVNGLATAPPNPAAFGMDPYTTLGLMEQEYARVMAEDAHLKAINARKQRPKKFKCPHCDVAFSNNGQLKGHIRIHTGERPFKCDVETCGKTFTRNEELTRHKRIHTGLRPYPCTACGKKFGRRDHLKKHMKTHMPQERQLGPAIFVPMYPYLYGF